MLMGVMAGWASGQSSTSMGSRTVAGSWDASNALATKPMKAGVSLPATCATGEAFFKTDAAGGQNLYLCKPDNAWTQVGAAEATSHTVVFDGSTAPGGETTTGWSCGSGPGAVCSTQWTAPAGVKWVRVQAWAGGGGGGGSRHDDRSGAGGGGGGYWETVCNTTPGAPVIIAVGLGGGASGDGYAEAGAGGNSSFGSCFTVLGGAGGSQVSPWGGMLSGANRLGWFTSILAMRDPAATSCNQLGRSAGFSTTRTDGGGCGGGMNDTQGAGPAGGSAIAGGGGGGGGGHNSATGGTGGASAMGGAGGTGGGWTAAGGLVACTAGAIPGGGGGAAGVAAGGANQTGCNGARGEVRVHYAR